MRKVLIFILCIAMVFSMTTITFANETTINVEGEIVSFIQLSDKQMIISEAEKTSLISIKETGTRLIVTTKNINSGEESYFIRDFEKDTLYSSITGYTGTLNIDESAAVGWYYVTYNMMAPYFNDIIDVVDIASYVTSISGGVTVLNIVLNMISAVLQAIRVGLAMQDPNSGIKYLINYVTITEHHGGSSYEIQVKRVTDFGIFG